MARPHAFEAPTVSWIDGDPEIGKRDAAITDLAYKQLMEERLKEQGQSRTIPGAATTVLKVLTWNLGYWQYGGTHDAAWDYLCHKLRPDIALLQEVKPPAWVSCDNLVFEQVTRGWGTAVYAPSCALTRVPFSPYPGRVAVACALIGGEPLHFVSIHAPIINNRVFPHLGNIFSELESMEFSHRAVVGGDLNSARLAESVWPGCGHGPFFEQIDTGSPWVDCYRRFHDVETQTFFRASCQHLFQDDHIFVSSCLSQHLSSCEVINNDATRSFSDHIPLQVDLEV